MATKKTTTTETKKTKTASKPRTSSKKEENKITAGSEESYCYIYVNLSNNSKTGEIVDFAAASSDGKVFYGEITDYMKVSLDSTVITDVVNKLPEFKMIAANFKDCTSFVGSRQEVSEKFYNWVVDSYPNKELKMVQLVMDKIEWNWPLFKDFIYSNKKEWPFWMSPCICDLNTDIASAITVRDNETGKNVLDQYIPCYVAYVGIDRTEAAMNAKVISDEVATMDNFNPVKKALVIRGLHRNIWCMK